MNVVAAVREYVNNMVLDVPGMKCMLLDEETVQIISMAYTQSQILEKEVFLITQLSMDGREDMMHLKCLCFLRPTDANVARLVAELHRPKYSEYHLFFSNELSKSALQELAEADGRKVVHQVHEFYGDFLAIQPSLFSLNLPSVGGPSLDAWHPEVFRRVSDGVFAGLAALKLRPTIRYAGKSPRARVLANELRTRLVRSEELFAACAPRVATCLIIDRRDDPVTPLLAQWTYQAMVHELIGITNNRVKMAGVGGAKRDAPDLVLSADQDEFYRNAMFQNFGDLGDSLKALVDRFQAKDATTRNISTLADMKRFIEDYPEFRKEQGAVSKHVTLTTELSRIVTERNLMPLSELEQDIACANSHATHVRALNEAIANPSNAVDDLLRAALIYALRYEEAANEVPSIVEALLARGLSREDAKAFSALKSYAGAAMRGGDLFKNKSVMQRLRQRVARGAAVVESVFAQHTTMLQEIVTAALEARLSDKDEDFPYAHGTPTRDRPTDVFVFVIGGACYEEAVYTARVNAEGTRMVLGSTWVHNSRSFVAEVLDAVAGTAPATIAVASAAGVASKYRAPATRAEAGPA